LFSGRHVARMESGDMSPHSEGSVVCGCVRKFRRRGLMAWLASR